MSSLYKVEYTDGISIVTVLSDKDFHEKHAQFLQDFKLTIGNDATKFILDMRHVDYLSSLMLSSLVFIHNKIVENDGQLVLCGLQSRVLDVIKIIHLDTLFVIAKDLQEAMTAFSGSLEGMVNLSRQLPSQIELVPGFMNEAIDHLKKHLVLNEDQIFDIKLVLEEALTNAIRHGNRSQATRKVDVNISCEDKHLIIEIRNEGEGFDVNKVPDPTTPKGLHKTSGRGVFLMRKIMDEVIYSDQGRQLTMIKKFL